MCEHLSNTHSLSKKIYQNPHTSEDLVSWLKNNVEVSGSLLYEKASLQLFKVCQLEFSNLSLLCEGSFKIPLLCLDSLLQVSM